MGIKGEKNKRNREFKGGIRDGIERKRDEIGNKLAENRSIRD
jgi:hypothetical protein